MIPHIAISATIPPQDVDAMYQFICYFDAIKTSMLVDKLIARPLEIDAIGDAISRRARQ